MQSRGSVKFYCKFIIKSVKFPEKLADFDGYFNGQVTIIQCELSHLVNTVIEYRGSLPSILKYWEFSSSNFFLSNDKKVLCIANNAPMHYINVTLVKPFDHLKWLYYELKKQPKKRGGIEFDAKLINALLQNNDIIDNDTGLLLTWEMLKSCPSWKHLFGYKCDAARLPLIIDITRFFVYESSDPSKAKRVYKSKKISKRLDVLDMMQLEDLHNILTKTPWMLCMHSVVKEFKLPEMSMHGFNAATKHFKIEMKNKQLFTKAISIYHVLKYIREKTHSTCISLSYLKSQCPRLSPQESENLFYNACKFLDKRCIMLLPNANVGLLQDYEYAQTIFTCIKKLIYTKKNNETTTTTTTRGFLVPCIPHGPFEPEQQAAAEHILTHKFSIVEGYPGTGKCVFKVFCSRLTFSKYR